VRAWRLQLSVTAILPKNGVSFITLTLCGANQSLAEKIDRLYKHFKALRNHPTWAENVKGGVAFLEVKWSDKAQRWHPHLHILAQARYIEKGDLTRAWFSISKDSYIIDIQRVREKAKVANYVTKYASKPLNTSFSNTPELLDEAVLALKGRRLAFAFGSWFGHALNLEEDDLLNEGDENDAEWESFMPLQELIDQCNHGDVDSINLIKSLGAETQWRMSLSSGP
jgi:hypothetical protein